jgi:uroporphyrinogen decarboxylase
MPDWEALDRCIRRQGETRRVHFFELYLDPEIQAELCARMGLEAGLDKADPFFEEQRQVRIQSRLGYDYVRCGLDGLDLPANIEFVRDTAARAHAAGRKWEDEHNGPVQSWADFERYPWPDPATASTRSLEWYEANLPEGMCVVGSSGYASGIGFGRFFKSLSSLMGYERLCMALYEERELVEAVVGRLVDLYRRVLEVTLQFRCVRFVLSNDDMGFKTGPLVAPDDLRELILPAHRLMARMAHDAGRPYILHSCGNLGLIMEDLIGDVGIDAKHSFEDAILPVTEAKRLYGDRIAVLGGIDMDFISRRSTGEVRQRVRDTLAACMPGGGYALGTGNSVANYVPVENFLAMLDEGRRFGA